jgi:hypothetical protein
MRGVRCWRGDNTEMEKYKRQFGKRVDVWTQEAEKAMRQLIDIGDEVAMQEGLLEGIAGRIALGRRDGGADVDEDEDGESKVVVNTVELLFEAKEDYKRRYKGKNMTKRYVLFMSMYLLSTLSLPLIFPTISIPLSPTYHHPSIPILTPPQIRPKQLLPYLQARCARHLTPRSGRPRARQKIDVVPLRARRKRSTSSSSRILLRRNRDPTRSKRPRMPAHIKDISSSAYECGLQSFV